MTSYDDVVAAERAAIAAGNRYKATGHLDDYDLFQAAYTLAKELRHDYDNDVFNFIPDRKRLAHELKQMHKESA